MAASLRNASLQKDLSAVRGCPVSGDVAMAWRRRRLIFLGGGGQQGSSE